NAKRYSLRPQAESLSRHRSQILHPHLRPSPKTRFESSANRRLLPPQKSTTRRSKKRKRPGFPRRGSGKGMKIMERRTRRKWRKRKYHNGADGIPDNERVP